jgi:hypothetical protein
MQVAIKRACAHPAAKQVILTEYADKVMEALLKLQATRQSVNDEVVMTMSVLCQEQGAAFKRYLQHAMPHIITGLTRHEDLQARSLTLALFRCRTRRRTPPRASRAIRGCRRAHYGTLALLQAVVDTADSSAIRTLNGSSANRLKRSNYMCWHVDSRTHVPATPCTSRSKVHHA